MPEPIIAKYQFNVPGQPEKPIVRDFDRNWAEVEWEPPISNGGSRILGYNLQYRDAQSHKWITANKELITGTSFKCTNLRDLGKLGGGLRFTPTGSPQGSPQGLPQGTPQCSPLPLRDDPQGRPYRFTPTYPPKDYQLPPLR